MPWPVVPRASLTIWWSVASWFNHVTVVPFATVMLAGTNAKFWILTVAAPGTCVGVVGEGPELVHPAIAVQIIRIMTSIARQTGSGVHLIQITRSLPLPEKHKMICVGESKI